MTGRRPRPELRTEVGPPPRVELRGIRKRFGAVRALDGADLTLRAGEVHGLLGENGAGKTTLLNILGGLHAPDGGTIRLSGREISLATPRDARAEGIGFVHQHFALVSRFTVLENLALGLRGGGPGVPRAQVRERIRELVGRTGFEVDLDAPVEALGVGRRQRVEILKALLPDPGVLVLDEPTAVLTPHEVEGLLKLLRDLARDGHAVALVAHKLDEVLAVADAVTVLRRGRSVLTAPRGEVDGPMLARAMVGRELAAEVGGAGHPTPRAAARASVRRETEGAPVELVAVLENVELSGPGGATSLRGVDLVVRRGEIVGVAGVEGNGQAELALVLAGRRAPDRGRASIPDDPAFVPQDRRGQGLVLDFDLAENLALGLHRDPEFRRGPFLRWRAVRDRTAEVLERYRVVAGGVRSRAGSLSGGNQQRVVVARELARSPDLLVAENPTRGLDVAAEAYVHRQIRDLARGGEGRKPAGVVLVSTDLDEVLGLADRILVMVRGRLREVPADQRTREAVGRLMLAAGGVG